MNEAPRILICEFHQESNSFNPVVWDIEKFKSLLVCEGETLMKAYSGMRSTLLGMCDAIMQAGGEIIPGCAFRASSGGPVDHSVVELFISKTIAAIRAARPLDGIFISLHGGTQSTKDEDACGMALEAIRAEAGKEIVIALGCDMHANITDRLAGSADFITGYLTYPHTDYWETGYRAASLGLRRIRGDSALCTARAKIPMIVPASGYSSCDGAYKEILDKGSSLVRDGEIADFSIFPMQPWLDVSCASSIVLATATDEARARRYAAELARMLYAKRKLFWPSLTSIDAIIEVARKNQSGKPVLLIDAADSPNAGAAGDSAVVVARLLALCPSMRAATFVTDRVAVETAFAAGVGNRARFRLGSSLTPRMPEPIEVDAYVQSLHDGIFTYGGAGGRGIQFGIGRSAVLKVGMIDILVCQSPGGTGDPQLYRHFGIEPSFYQLVVVKACTSFRDQYAQIASEICMADTQGAACSDLTSLPFERIPKETFYPFADLGDDLDIETYML